MQWIREDWFLFVALVASCIELSMTEDCKKTTCKMPRKLKKKGVKVAAVQGAPCSKRSYYYDVGANVGLTCTDSTWKLYGPSNVICREDGNWSTDLSNVQCTKESLLHFQDLDLWLHLSHSNIRRCAHSETCPLTENIERQVGSNSQLSLTCEIRWKSCDIKKFPNLKLGWYLPDGSIVPGTGQPSGFKAELDVKKFTEAGAYVYTCKIAGWFPWPDLHAVVNVDVKKALCPEITEAYNTHIWGEIKEENRTVGSKIEMWPNPGYATPDGGPLTTECMPNEQWYPAVSDLTVERIQCPWIDIDNQVGPRVQRVVDGPQNGNYLYQSLIELSCPNDFAMVGESRIYCNASGTWDPPVPTCKRISCGNPPTIHGVHCNCPNNSIEAVCNCSCSNGYHSDTRSESQLKCLPSGWSPTVNRLPMCVSCNCSRRGSPDGWAFEPLSGRGWKKVGKRKVYCKGAMATAVCRKNRSVRKTMFCDGDHWSWDSQPPQCR